MASVLDDKRNGALSRVVGIGASAGGLEALQALFADLPNDTGMAFVIVQHTEPRHDSMLCEILSPTASMPILKAMDGERLRPNHVYIAPAADDLIVEGVTFRIVPRGLTRKIHLPIDTFFCALAETFGLKAIGIVLSGTGSDGTVGLQDIKTQGGITFAQDEQSAKHTAMPRSAISSGCVDHVLPPTAIAAALGRIATLGSDPEAPLEAEKKAAIGQILSLLRDNFSVDFSEYKQTTIIRRIQKRLAAIKASSFVDYFELLKRHQHEQEALYRDILINVTSFFRDPEMFDALQTSIFPQVIRDRATDDPIRIWVPGCSSGEEVYSLAFSLAEYGAKVERSIPLQIFGTDISEPALENARAGQYPASIASLVSPQRLADFFDATERGYRVKKAIRETCVFAHQNVIADPPLSKMDIISCRNLLIYFGAALQERMIPIFHYALKPTNGYLVLGKSELVDIFSDYFVPVDKTHRFYLKKATAARMPLHLLPGRKLSLSADPVKPQPNPQSARDTALEVQRETDRFLLANFSPTAVVITENMDIVQFRGNTTPYLKPSGRASFNLFKMIHPDLAQPIRLAVDKAMSGDARAIKCNRLRYKTGTEYQFVDVRIGPLRTPALKERYLLLVFEETRPALAKGRPAITIEKEPDAAEITTFNEADEIRRLSEELEQTRQHLRAVIDDREIGFEELQSANEEVTSSNEELQTLNQELETAKEELESSNEELTTLNEQLRHSMDELRKSEEHFRALVSSVKDYAIFMLDPQGYILSWNEGAERINGYTKQEVLGEHVSIFYPEESRRSAKAEEELRVASTAGRFEEIGLRVRKDGSSFWANVVITPILNEHGNLYGFAKVTRDITERIHAEESLRNSELRFRRLTSVVKDYAIYMIDPKGYVLSWNEGAERIKGYKAEEIVGQHFSKFYTKEDRENGKTERELEIAERTGSYEEEDWRVRKDGTRFWANVIITAIRDEHGTLAGFSKVTRDLTEKKVAQDALRKAKEDLEVKVADRTRELKRSNEQLLASNAELERFAFVASHDLKEPLRMVSTYLQYVEKRLKDKLGPEEKEFIGFAVEGALRMKALVDDLLTYSRLGKSEEASGPVDFNEAVEEARANLRTTIEQSEARITVSKLPTTTAVRSQMVQLFQNLLANAIKYRGERAPEIHVSATGKDHEWVFSVRDNGIGIEPQYAERIFVLFQRLHSDRQKYPGTGVGLAICKRIVDRHGGRIWMEPNSDAGTTFHFTLPR